MLLFTGFSRTASDVAGEQIKNIPKIINQLHELKQFTDDACSILNGRIKGFDDFGRLLNETWMIKRKLTKLITNGAIDDIYDAALKEGALGGKLCGAGNGGFLLLYVPAEYQKTVKEKLYKGC